MTLASTIPLIWLAIASVGLWLAFHLIRDSYLDLKELDKFGIRNGRRAIALTTVRTEIIRSSYHLIFFGLGLVYSITNLEPTRPLVAAIMTVAQLGLVLSTYLVIKLREELHG